MSLVLEDIRHAFGERRVLDGVSLEARPSEILCLFGPSGCGKTTLFRIAAGLEPLQSGRVSLEGRTLAGDGAATPPEARPIGFVFQDYVLFPHLTVQDNIAFGLRGRPTRDKREEAQRELDAVGLPQELARAYPHELSGGQQQRVALARAFARRPRAMLLDEPFASVDAAARRKLRGDVREIIKEHGLATMIVTHDPEEALALGDRIAVMKGGRVVEIATPVELFDRPATPEGAAIFPGAQTFKGVVQDGALRTPFGDCPWTAGAGACVVVALSGAVVVVGSGGEGGRLQAVDSRFFGDGWRISLRVGDGGETLVARADAAVDHGASVSVEIDPEKLRVFPVA